MTRKVQKLEVAAILAFAQSFSAHKFRAAASTIHRAEDPGREGARKTSARVGRDAASTKESPAGGSVQEGGVKPVRFATSLVSLQSFSGR